MGAAAVRELCSIDITDSGVPSPVGKEGLNSRNLGDYIAGLPGGDGAQAASGPRLSYFYSRAKVRGRTTLTKQAVACKTLENTLFAGSDTRIGVAAKFFIRRKYDVTKVTRRENQVFNAENAPIVVLTATDGSVVSCFSRRVSGTNLLAGMLLTLRKSGIDARAVLRADPILTRIRSLEDRKVGAKSTRSRAEADLKKARKSGNRTTIMRREQYFKKAAADLAKIEDDLKKAREELDKLVAAK